MAVTASLFIVEAPLQLINAVEAREYYGVPREHAFLVIKRGVSRENQAQTRRLCVDEDWAAVLEIGDPKSVLGYFGCNRAVAKWVKQHRLSVARVLIGDYRSRYMRHVANWLGGDVVLLDDGAASLTVANNRRAGVAYARRYDGFKRLFNKQALLGYRDGDVSSLTYFSAYRFDIPETDRHDRNDYAYLRVRLGSYSHESVWYFIGSPLVEVGILTPEVYLSLLKTIASFHREKVVYVPHRRESEKNVNAWCEALGWNVRRFERPLELEVVEADSLPEGIMGFYSNALPGVSRLLGRLIEVECYHLKADKISRKELAPQIEDVYRNYALQNEQSNFRVLNMDGSNYLGC